MSDQPDPMTLRVRQMVADIVEEFGGDAPPNYNVNEPKDGPLIPDGQLMELVGDIMNKCGLRFVAYIVEE